MKLLFMITLCLWQFWQGTTSKMRTDSWEITWPPVQMSIHPQAQSKTTELKSKTTELKSGTDTLPGSQRCLETSGTPATSERPWVFLFNAGLIVGTSIKLLGCFKDKITSIPTRHSPPVCSCFYLLRCLNLDSCSFVFTERLHQDICCGMQQQKTVSEISKTIDLRSTGQSVSPCSSFSPELPCSACLSSGFVL